MATFLNRILHSLVGVVVVVVEVVVVVRAVVVVAGAAEVVDVVTRSDSRSNTQYLKNYHHHKLPCARSTPGWRSCRSEPFPSPHRATRISCWRKRRPNTAKTHSEPTISLANPSHSREERRTLTMHEAKHLSRHKFIKNGICTWEVPRHALWQLSIVKHGSIILNTCREVGHGTWVKQEQRIIGRQESSRRSAARNICQVRHQTVWSCRGRSVLVVRD